MRLNEEKKFSGLKVLIVEDQQEIRMFIRDVLIGMGFQHIFEAPHGRSAMDFMDADLESVDLIISDWNMPNMEGIELLRQIRTVYPDMPFLMVTGRGYKSDIIEAKGAGVTGYIRKPFSPEQMENKVRVLIQQLEKPELKNAYGIEPSFADTMP